MPAAPISSPDTKGAAWTVSAERPGDPFRQCRPAAAADARMPPARRPGRPAHHPPRRRAARAKALFPVIGNGLIARFQRRRRAARAASGAGKARCRRAIPCSTCSPAAASMEATLPGGGSLLIEGSRIPGEFVTWCRSGGSGAAGGEGAEAGEARRRRDGIRHAKAQRRPGQRSRRKPLSMFHAKIKACRRLRSRLRAFARKSFPICSLLCSILPMERDIASRPPAAPRDLAARAALLPACRSAPAATAGPCSGRPTFSACWPRPARSWAPARRSG